MKPTALKFTQSDSEKANADWKASCGPHSLAAACGKTLHQINEAMAKGAVNYRGWMSPTQVSRTLDALGAEYILEKGISSKDLCHGINRIQWEGKWLNPGVPARIAYFHTHYVAHDALHGLVLCTACEAAEWITTRQWLNFHLEQEPKSPFHVTHHWNINPSRILNREVNYD